MLPEVLLPISLPLTSRWAKHGQCALGELCPRGAIGSGEVHGFDAAFAQIGFELAHPFAGTIAIGGGAA